MPEKVLTLFQIFDRKALDVVPAIIKLCRMTKPVENGQQVIINFLAQVSEARAPVQVSSIG